MEIGVNSGVERLTDPDSKLLPEGPEAVRASMTPPIIASSRTVIGRYRILQLVGEGGMGVVYEAEQDHLRRTVALKIIKPGSFGGDRWLELTHQGRRWSLAHWVR